MPSLCHIAGMERGRRAREASYWFQVEEGNWALGAAVPIHVDSN